MTWTIPKGSFHFHFPYIGVYCIITAPLLHMLHLRISLVPGPLVVVAAQVALDIPGLFEYRANSIRRYEGAENPCRPSERAPDHTNADTIDIPPKDICFHGRFDSNLGCFRCGSSITKFEFTPPRPKRFPPDSPRHVKTKKISESLRRWTNRSSQSSHPADLDQTIQELMII